MDATHLQFPDASFDLVVSHNMMHEVAAAALPQIFKESVRVLSPGGLVLHQDVLVRSNSVTPFERFMFSWQTHHNNEPFWEDFADADVVGELIAAGFEPDAVSEVSIPTIDGYTKPWYGVLGEKPSAKAS
jgi:ubiquinone/menaquinone biosynthesis C-methylase UbiE